VALKRLHFLDMCDKTCDAGSSQRRTRSEQRRWEPLKKEPRPGRRAAYQLGAGVALKSLDTSVICVTKPETQVRASGD
jgi:hypothetical protein